MRKRFLIGSLGVMAVSATTFLVATRSSDAQQTAPSPQTLAVDTTSLPGPRQPIFFRHDIHAGQFKIQCQYCHATVAVSSEPGVPSMQTCMGCHATVQGRDSTDRLEIKKLRDAWAAGTPVQWTRIHNVARHVRFPHNVHINALGTNGCATCHGNVSRMPQVYKVNNVNNMGFCITCHIERNVTRDCTACHY